MLLFKYLKLPFEIFFIFRIFLIKHILSWWLLTVQFITMIATAYLTFSIRDLFDFDVKVFDKVLDDFNSLDYLIFKDPLPFIKWFFIPASLQKHSWRRINIWKIIIDLMRTRLVWVNSQVSLSVIHASAPIGKLRRHEILLLHLLN